MSAQLAITPQRVASNVADQGPEHPRHKADYVGVDDAILREALKNFTLKISDAEIVEDRFDLSPARQVRFGLRSAPAEQQRDAAALSILLRFGDQSRFIAPLWHDDLRMRINAPLSGLLMPVVRGGLMRAWLNYADPYDDAPKWVTSSRFPRGCKVRPSIHVVNPEYAQAKGVAILTTHALEAEAISGGGIVSVAGINGLRSDALVLQLREEWPGLRAVDVCTEEPMPAVVRALRLAGLRVTEGGDDE